MQDVKTITIDLKERAYPVFIGKGLLKNVDSLLKPYLRGKAFIVSDENVAPLYLERVAAALDAETIVIPAGEPSKCWQTVQAVTDAVLDKGCDRRSALISLGGGVVGDITGFCASILERGVDFIQIPTTLLAQTDSSVGGKTAIDTKAGKNLIGTFHQPKAVVIDTDTLRTLPRRQILAGYAEVAKYGLIKRADFWEWLEQQRPRRGTRFEKAVNYAQNRKESLMMYLEDGHCSFSNNLSENAIRPFTVGRKNWLFSSSPKGAEASALTYTMVEMAKVNDLNVYRYLEYLLEHRPDAKMVDEQLSELAPWSDKVKASCQKQ